MIYEKSPLNEALGNTSNLQILSFFISNQQLDYSVTDIAKNTKLSRQTIYKCLTPLLQFNMIQVSRKIGYTKLYKLNEESEGFRNILSLNEELVKIIVSMEKKMKSKTEVDLQDVLDSLKKPN